MQSRTSLRPIFQSLKIGTKHGLPGIYPAIWLSAIVTLILVLYWQIPSLHILQEQECQTGGPKRNILRPTQEFQGTVQMLDLRIRSSKNRSLKKKSASCN